MTTTLSQNIRVGLFFLFGLALVWIVYENFDSTASEKVRGYKLHAPFNNLLQLKNNDEVRLAGVKIGVVSKTYLVNHHAVAELQIYQNVKIPSDSLATITTAGLLGNNYISIVPGNSESNLTNDNTIKTKETMDLNSVIAKVGDLATHFDEFASSFSGGGKEGSVFYNLNEVLTENRENLKVTISNFAEFSQKLNSEKSTLGRLLNDDSLYTQAKHVLNKVDTATSSISDSGPISAVGAAAGALF